MEIVMSNKNDPVYQAMLDDLIQEVFGFSFAPWFEYELWDDNYESYSIIENGKMLSNICIYKADLTIQGVKTPAIQFGAVATRKAERGKGYSRILMAHVLALYPNTPSFLFANEGVRDFYPKFSFRQVQNHIPQITVDINNAHAPTMLDIDGDFDFIRTAMQNRVTSGVLDCTNSQSIQFFHLIMAYWENIYHLPGCGAIVIAKQKGDKLTLVDVIATVPITFEKLAAELPFAGIRTVQFGFNPDWLGVSPTWTPNNMTENPFFIKGEWDLPQHFIFPKTSET